MVVYLLAREVLYLRGEIPRDQEWDVMVDLFMYKSEEQQKQNAIQEEEGNDEEEEEGENKVSEQVNKFQGNQEGDDEEEEDGEDDGADDAWNKPATLK